MNIDWRTVPCAEAHPTKTCAEYDEWLDLIEAESAAEDQAAADITT